MWNPPLLLLYFRLSLAGISAPIKGSGPNRFLRGCSLVIPDLALIMSHKPGFPV